MEKRLGVTQVRQNLAEVIDEVRTKGESYIVLRHGEPAAALVPIEVYEQWLQSRESLFEAIRALQGLHPDADPDEIMREVLRVQQEVRSQGKEAAS
mgnify:FL=1